MSFDSNKNQNHGCSGPKSQPRIPQSALWFLGIPGFLLATLMGVSPLKAQSRLFVQLDGNAIASRPSIVFELSCAQADATPGSSQKRADVRFIIYLSSDQDGVSPYRVHSGWIQNSEWIGLCGGSDPIPKVQTADQSVTWEFNVAERTCKLPEGGSIAFRIRQRATGEFLPWAEVSVVAFENKLPGGPKEKVARNYSCMVKPER